MKHVIVGTAGHIDHGKTALVKALTGIDADRLEEEKRRGITIDLGFAHLQLTPALRLGFVDVPGHERFVRNMLAGVGSIDLVLFVVAADESIKPQTREHFDICRLLAIPRGVIALTKSDLVESDLLGLVRLEIEELVAGSFLEGAAIVPVSSTTGAGLDELRTELARSAASVPERDAGGPFRLPVDRVFSVKGFGTVATGTLISGSVAREQEVELYPRGLRLRVRGVEVHGDRTGRAVAGQRTAVNIPDAEPSELTRGDVLAEPGRFQAVKRVDCRLDLLRSARPLKHRAPVHFHSGAAEIEAEVRLLEGPGPLAPGASAYARLVLREPALLLPGDRFIVRMFSPVVTIGGGVVLDWGDRRYRTPAEAAARLGVLAAGDPAARIALLVRETEFGAASADLAARTGMTDDAIARAAAGAGMVTLAQPHPWHVDRPWFDAARARLLVAVRGFHAANALAGGIARQDLRARELLGCPLHVFDALLAAEPGLSVDGETVRVRGHQLALTGEEERARSAIEQAFETAGLEVPAWEDVIARTGLDTARARRLLEMLVREGRLVRAGADLVFHRSAIERVHSLLAPRRAQRFNVAAFKQWTGISRKYAIPLLEFLDREHVTRREGDQRLVL